MTDAEINTAVDAALMRQISRLRTTWLEARAERDALVARAKVDGLAPDYWHAEHSARTRLATAAGMLVAGAA